MDWACRVPSRALSKGPTSPPPDLFPARSLLTGATPAQPLRISGSPFQEVQLNQLATRWSPDTPTNIPHGRLATTICRAINRADQTHRLTHRPGALARPGHALPGWTLAGCPAWYASPVTTLAAGKQ
jgi:hypothetical protein